MKKKLEEVIEELEVLSEGSLISSGLGSVVSFYCNCGAENKRRSDLLNGGQVVSCINLDCSERWEVSFDGDEIYFERMTIKVSCKACNCEHSFPETVVLDLALNTVFRFECECGTTNYLRWQLMQLDKKE